MSRRVFVFFFVGVLFLGVGQANATSIIYSQPSTFPIFAAYASQNDPDPGGFGNFATVYDNFVLAGNALVTDVHWQGGFYNGGPAPITAFTIAFSADALGQPGGAILSQTVAGNAGQTAVGSALGVEVFNYSLVLPTSFFATAGTQYWLSIVPTMSFPPQWVWVGDVTQNNVSFQDFFGTRAPLTVNFAFDLTGDAATAVPEPVSLTLVGSGVVAVIGRRLRRRQKLTR